MLANIISNRNRYKPFGGMFIECLFNFSFLLSHLSEGSASAEKYFGSTGKEDLKYQVGLFAQTQRILAMLTFSYALI